jgi:hypothetical protein
MNRYTSNTVSLVTLSLALVVASGSSAVAFKIAADEGRAVDKNFTAQMQAKGLSEVEIGFTTEPFRQNGKSPCKGAKWSKDFFATSAAEPTTAHKYRACVTPQSAVTLTPIKP